MATKCTGPGLTSRRATAGDSLGSGQATQKIHLNVAKSIESDYYAKRAAEAEQRRLERLRPRVARYGVKHEVFEKACHVLWLYEKEFARTVIADVLDVTLVFINNVIMSATCRDAVAKEPPDEIIQAAIAADG